MPFIQIILNSLRTVQQSKLDQTIPIKEHLRALIEFQQQVEHWHYYATNEDRSRGQIDTPTCIALRNELKQALYLSWPGCEQPTVNQRVDLALLLIEQYKEHENG